MMVLAHSHHYLSISVSLLNSMLVVHSLHNDQNLFISFIWNICSYIHSTLFYSNHHLSSVFVNICCQFGNMHNPLYCRHFHSLLCSCINKIYAVVWFITKSSIITCSSSYYIWAAFNTNFSYQSVMQMPDVTVLQTKNNYFRSFLEWSEWWLLSDN